MEVKEKPPTRVYRGQGRNQMVMDLFPDRVAAGFQTPLELMPDSGHDGDLPWESAGLEISPASVHVLALKAAEDGKGWILRVMESKGDALQAQIRCGAVRRGQDQL